MTTAALSGHGIVDYNTTSASVRPKALGISGVNRIADGQIEVTFSDPYYTSLESTVVVSVRSSLPQIIAWDTYGSRSIRVQIWDQSGAAARSGSFSILLVQRRP